MENTKEVFFQVIKDRRSIRKYTEQRITEEDLRLILESARQAPSGENAQPWRFIVIKDQDSKDFLSYVGKHGSGRRFTGEFLSKQMQARFTGLQDEEKKIAAYKKLTSGNVSSFVSEADVNIIVLGKKEVWDAPFDTSAAIENMLLTVTSLGLGACWLVAPCIDIRDELRMKEYFEITDEYKLFAIISIGYPAKMANPRPRIPLKDLVFNEKFGEAYYEE
ncbi:nitroreductase family protein [Sedimentibacter hydroxybenzoicus DSM 7310]|uniref:Nitroreductase family protein n=1 Tax=Sedimentibacter hydroxybenzoicus DSM 7310 TaxID=1123245 RepID=A0A974GX86_SEDHY|nr:nitroreductase family protein [Sedimentibacter hydroxybenzoicus]NYB74815.1 nitroreductase family protein [Sedimentibacter hydroxybenzoicus DSM 7310]